MRFGLADQTLALIQKVFVPLRHGDGLLLPAEILPKRFHGAKFFLQCHPVKFKDIRHKANLPSSTEFANATSLRPEIGDGREEMEGATTGLPRISLISQMERIRQRDYE